MEYPTLGVCLGHQALCAANGAPVGHAEAVVHGKSSSVTHDGTGVFEDISDPFEVGRYHSLAVDRENLPDVLTETAYTVSDDAEAAAVPESADAATADGTDESQVVMGVASDGTHFGTQFHPENPVRPLQTCRNFADYAIPRKRDARPRGRGNSVVRDRGSCTATRRSRRSAPTAASLPVGRPPRAPQRTAETLGFADAVPEDLGERVDETLAANDLEEAYVRLSVTRSVQPGNARRRGPTSTRRSSSLQNSREAGSTASASGTNRRRLRRPDPAGSQRGRSSGREDPQLPQRDPRPARTPKAAAGGEPADECSCWTATVRSQRARRATSFSSAITRSTPRVTGLDLLPGVTRDG